MTGKRLGWMRWAGPAALALMVIPMAMMAASDDPPADPPADAPLVQFELIHEEVDGGADSGVSPDGKWISFSTYRNGNRDIYIVSTETGEVKQITDDPADDYEARWHASSSKIVYVSERNGNQDIYILDLETGEETTVVDTANNEDYPSFSRGDGDMVVFTGGLRGFREVHTWNSKTGEVKAITRGHKLVGSTSFSPDNSKIAYHAYYDSYASARSDIWIVDSNGGEGVNITHNDDVWVYKAQWAKDGNWLAFSAKYDTPNFNIWVMRPDGTDRRKLTDDNEYDLRWADWTDDGRLVWHRIVPQQGRIIAMDVASGEKSEVAKFDFDVEELIPSPDGSQMLFVTDGTINVMDTRTGAEARELTVGVNPSWSADGKMVSFVRSRGRRVGFIPAAGGEAVIVEQSTVNEAAAPSRSFSPDGKSMAVIARTDSGQELAIITADGEMKTLTDDGFAKATPVFSADGKTIFYAENRPNMVGYYMTVDSVTAQMNAKK